MSDLAAINYEPLVSMDHAWKKVIKTSFGGRGWWVFGGVLLLTAVTLIFGGFIFLAAYGIFLGFRMKQYKNAVWEEFAVVNNWPLDTDTPPDILVPPSLQYGFGRRLSPILRAQIGQLQCDLFTYQYTISAGKSTQTFHFTVARVPTTKILPHIVLRSKKAHTRLEQDFENGETFHLEGDFDDYFKLEIEKGQEVDTLTVLTPEVMQTLVGYQQAEDVEIWGNGLYFILSNDKRDYKDTQLLIRSVDELGEQVVRNIAMTTVEVPPTVQTVAATAAAVTANPQIQ